jgi:hypothetical protein
MGAMSQTRPVRPPRPPRTVAGMVGALIVVVALGVLWVEVGGSDEKPTEVASADWQAWAKAGRADGKLTVLAPAQLPNGWRATSAAYESGSAPLWRMGMLTGAKKFVGLAESAASTDDLVQEYVDENAERGGDVTVAGETWQSWTDSGGDYAVVRTLATPSGGQERVLVYGSAPDGAIRDFAASLSAQVVPTG